jgi:hypothetical protein
LPGFLPKQQEWGVILTSLSLCLMICLRGNILQILLLESYPGLCFHIHGKEYCYQYSLRCNSAGCPVSVSPEGFIRISTDAGLLRRYPKHCCFGLLVLQPVASVLNTFQPDNLIRLRIIYPHLSCD